MTEHQLTSGEPVQVRSDVGTTRATVRGVKQVQPTVAWTGDAIEILDQTALPERERILRLTTVDEVVDAIRRLAVRGAPAIGVTGAFGRAGGRRRGGR